MSLGVDFKFPEEEGAPPLVERMAKRLFALRQWGKADYPFQPIEWREADREHYRTAARDCIEQIAQEREKP